MVLGHLLGEMFNWPQGIVVGNLIASFLIWVPHIIHSHIRFRRLERKIDAKGGTRATPDS